MGDPDWLRVLCVGADPRVFELLRVFLDLDAERRYAFRALQDPELAQVELAAGGTDCLLLVHEPPDFDAIAFLGELCGPDARVPVPVIVLDEGARETVAESALRAGALDCAAWGRLTPEALSRSVRNAVSRGRLEREIAERQGQLERSQRRQLALKDRLISHVSHELRTPLTAIAQFASILRDEVAGPLSDAQREYLDVVVRNVGALRDMIDDLMEAGRCDAGKLHIEPHVMALEPLVRDCVDALRPAAAEKGQELSLGGAAALPAVVADPVRVRQVLGNLLDNAIKFSPAQTTIAVELEPSARAPGFVEIAVRDRGCGIRPERLSRIFDRLHQERQDEPASRRGLGLGLYIARELIQGQGGEIWAESEPGAGSRFCFTLPQFALDRILERGLGAEAQAREGLFLLEVDVGTRSAAPLEEAAVRALYRALTQCVYPGRDLVLPRFQGGAESAGAVFYALASADRAGARAMCERLESVLKPCAEVESDDIEVQIRSESVARGPQGESDAADWRALADRVTGLIEALRPPAAESA